MNAGADLTELVRAVARYQLRDKILPAPTGSQASAAELAKYTGFYRDASPRAALFRIVTDVVGSTRILVRGDTLFERSIVGEARPLIPTAPVSFGQRTRPPVAARSSPATMAGWSTRPADHTRFGAVAGRCRSE